MQKIGFIEALEEIVAKDPRYHRDGYLFLRDALDFTLTKQKRTQERIPRHVTGQDLLEGVRLFALQEFGPMVPTVFSEWGIHRGEDVGEMVFKLVNAGIFGRSENDSLDDFRGGYSFHEAFVEPFLPSNRLMGGELSNDQTSSPKHEMDYSVDDGVGPGASPAPSSGTDH